MYRTQERGGGGRKVGEGESRAKESGERVTAEREQGWRR